MSEKRLLPLSNAVFYGDPPPQFASWEEWLASTDKGGARVLGPNAVALGALTESQWQLAVDAAMAEMRSVSPPLRRSECEHLIRAALAALGAPLWSRKRSDEGPRGSGRTRSQLDKAPSKAVFVWCNDKLEYPRALAYVVGRGDITVLRSRWLDEPVLQFSRNVTDVVLDHALVLTPLQEQNIGILQARGVRVTR